ncbi:hypothetical protein [Helicobacter bizzozeronii]|uniref:hypothetical protein n=1 Tax=Helicobacter bizzozeronii TaxID=56877 RepID=UPI000CF15C3C|nr:hypothetical protein [Helicobacter bizzozeronii]
MAIASAVQKGTRVYVYDEKNHMMFYKDVGKDGKLIGYTANCLTLKIGQNIYTFDEKNHQTSYRPA